MEESFAENKKRQRVAKPVVVSIQRR